jgi:hypothetical protein
LFVFNNRYATARGWIRTSVAFSVKDGQGGNRRLIHKSLKEGLDLNSDGGYYTIFRDHGSNLEYIRNNRELSDQGLFAELHAYQYYVFLDFRQVQDTEFNHYGQICSYLNGRGVPSIDDTVREIFLQPIHQSFRELVHPAFFRHILANHRDIVNREAFFVPDAVVDEANAKLLNLLHEIKIYLSSSQDETEIVDEVKRKLTALIESHPFVQDIIGDESDLYALLSRELSASHLAWLFVHSLGGLADGGGVREEISRSWIDEWLFGRIIAETLKDLGYDDKDIHGSQLLIKIFTSHQDWCKEKDPRVILDSFMGDSDVQFFLEVNRYQGILWFSKEAFEEVIAWMYFTGSVSIMSEKDGEEKVLLRELKRCFAMIEFLHRASLSSGYQLEKLIGIIQEANRAAMERDKATAAKSQDDIP